ncbi:MAG: type II toxin-antitoxin system VapC family toxin [Chloroflexi bacterium]|nr:type II toxin-antitoxin system VapC family toxin [Chloroflexota bacterium]
MILYLDASALVKRYVTEFGSDSVNQAIGQADLVGTALISRAQVAVAFAKAVRMDALKREEGSKCLHAFRKDWHDLVRVQVTEMAIARADTLAWEHNLRGYDAVHLATALVWQETMGEQVTMATFDQTLWSVAEKVGLVPFPNDLPALLKEWRVKGR